MYVYTERWDAILNRLVMMDLTEKMVFEQRFEALERVNHVDLWRKNMLAGRNS